MFSSDAITERNPMMCMFCNSKHLISKHRCNFEYVLLCENAQNVYIIIDETEMRWVLLWRVSLRVLSKRITKFGCHGFLWQVECSNFKDEHGWLLFLFCHFYLKKWSDLFTWIFSNSYSEQAYLSCHQTFRIWNQALTFERGKFFGHGWTIHQKCV